VSAPQKGSNLFAFGWRVVLLVGAAVLAWQVITTGLGDHYAQRLEQGDDTVLAQVLTWRPSHPEALYRQALRLLAESDDTEGDGRETALSRAYRADPTDARPLIEIAALRFRAEQPEQADALMEIAAALAPADPGVQLQMAAYWDQRQQPERALQHLSTALEVDRSLRREIFPALLQVAEQPARRGLLRPFATSSTSWWPSFFGYLSREAETIEAVRFAYNLRRLAPAEVMTDEERAAYVRRLQKDGLIGEAYLIWVNGLDSVELGQLGLLYNGGFELPLSNEGFGWTLQRNPRVEARPLATQGAVGERALLLRFRALETRFSDLQQPLFLQPGTYRLSGRVRPKGLESVGGLQWRLSCRSPETELLGESPRFLGSGEWRDFAFDFEVPPDCQYQLLVLASAGRRAFELEMNGVIWLDDMKITRTLGLDAASRADALLRDGAPGTETLPDVSTDELQ
jgi:hypothetical protein